jgi:hypothetical protein
MGWLSNYAWMAIVAALAVVITHDAAWSQAAAPQTDDLPTVALTAAELKVARSPACSDHKDCLKWFPQWFSQTKNLVRVKLADGKVKTFKENTQTDGEGWRTYGVRAYYPQWNSVVVGVGYSEGGDVMVINHLTGTSVTPLNVPQYSSNGEFFAAVGNCDAYCTEGIEIWSNASDPPKRLFKHEPVGGRRYEFAGWEGDDRLKVRVSLWGPDSKGKLPRDKSKPAEVVRGPKGWRLVEPELKEN